METLNLYRHQREAVEACVGASRGMIKMFCGTGKTRVMLGVIAAAEQVSVTLVVFPRIVLLEQFRADYISKSDWMPLVSAFDTAFVSSEDESIEAAMLALTSAGTKRVVVCVTYASLGKLVDTMCATGQLPGLLVFDEAHHCVADRALEVITEQLAGTRILYFTATPVSQMLDAVDTFGEVLFEYSYADGVADGVLKPFDVVVEIGAEDAPGGLYSQIVSTALATGNSHALVFHSYAEADATESRSSVKDYAGDVARGMLADSAKGTPYEKHARLEAVTSATRNKAKILLDFDSAADDELFVLHNCSVVAEGVDTRNTNMVVFTDAKASVSNIIQCIGRVVRIGSTERRGTVLLPVRIDAAAYETAAGNPKEFNALLQADGRFRVVFETLAALRQEFPGELEALMANPPRCTAKALLKAVKDAGYVVSEEGCEMAPDDDVNIITGEIGVPIEVVAPAVVLDADTGLYHDVNVHPDTTQSIIKAPSSPFGLCIRSSLASWRVGSTKAVRDRVWTAFLECDSLDEEARALTKVASVIAWADKTQGGAIPRTCKRNFEQMQQVWWLRTQRLRYRNGTIFPSVSEALGKKWPDWMKMQDLEDEALKKVAEIISRADVFREGGMPLLVKKKSQERSDSAFIRYQRKKFEDKTIFPSVSTALTVKWPGWESNYDREAEAHAVLTEIISWAEETQEGAMPVGRKDARHSRHARWIASRREDWRSGIIIPSIFERLVKKWPEWTLDPDIVELRKVKEIIHRAVTLREGAQPRDVTNKSKSQELSDSRQIGRMRRAYHERRGGSVDVYPSDAEAALSTQWPEWFREKDLEATQLAFCQQVFLRADELRGGTMPRIVKGGDKQQNVDAAWLHRQRYKTKGTSYSSVILALDTKWPNWKDNDKKTDAIRNALAVVERAKKRPGNAKPRNIRADKQQSWDSAWLFRQISAYIGRVNKACYVHYPEVTKILADAWGPTWHESDEAAGRALDALEKASQVIGRALLRGGALPSAGTVDYSWLLRQRKASIDGTLQTDVECMLDEQWGELWHGKPSGKRCKTHRPIQVKADDHDPDLPTSKRGPTFSPLERYHQRFKSRVAASYVAHIQTNPDEWREYHEAADAADRRDADSDKVLPHVASFVSRLPSNWSVVDLGCGMNRLKDLADSARTGTWTSVDAVSADDTVLSHDIGALPDAWTAKFDAAVLCRSIWSTDRVRIITEAVRVIHTGGRIIVCHGFNITKTKHWNEETKTNMLMADFRSAGCDIEYEQHTTPESASGLFQYFIAVKRHVVIEW